MIRGRGKGGRVNTWGEAEGPQVPRQVDLPSSRLLPTPEGLSVLDFAHRARTRISPSRDVSAPSESDLWIVCRLL